MRVAAFDLALDRAGSFGGTRVGWLGPTGTPSGLQTLWDALGLALDRHGVRSSVAAMWTPHVTVLRGMRQPLPVTAILPLAWLVDRFMLVHSQPAPGDYALLHRWLLQD